MSSGLSYDSVYFLPVWWSAAAPLFSFIRFVGLLLSAALLKKSARPAWRADLFLDDDWLAWLSANPTAYALLSDLCESIFTFNYN